MPKDERVAFNWKPEPLITAEECKNLKLPNPTELAKLSNPAKRNQELGRILDEVVNNPNGVDINSAHTLTKNAGYLLNTFYIPEATGPYDIKNIAEAMCTVDKWGIRVCKRISQDREKRRDAFIAFMDAARAIPAVNHCPQCFLVSSVLPERCNAFMQEAKDKACSQVVSVDDLTNNPNCCSRILDASGKPLQDEISQARIAAFNKFLETAKDFDLETDGQRSDFLLNSYVLKTPKPVEKDKDTTAIVMKTPEPVQPDKSATAMSLQRSLWANLIGCANVQGSWAQYVRMAMAREPRGSKLRESLVSIYDKLPESSKSTSSREEPAPEQAKPADHGDQT